jgi:hypothetical protein
MEMANSGWPYGVCLKLGIAWRFTYDGRREIKPCAVHASLFAVIYWHWPVDRWSQFSICVML